MSGPETLTLTPLSQVPVEIVDDDEMAIIDLAFASASTRPLLSSPVLPLASTAVLKFRSGLRSPTADIEDGVSTRRTRVVGRRGMVTVTDVTASEWCEKQMEFSLVHGKPQKTKAMKAGSSRHTELEKEVVKKVHVSIVSNEDKWALRFLNFIVGATQLLSEGLTRELPVGDFKKNLVIPGFRKDQFRININGRREDVNQHSNNVGALEGAWVIGVIDELRLPINGPVMSPLLVDTKTRCKPTLPSEAQKRNARLQLMCYKFLWDSIVDDSFSVDQLFKNFNLDPNCLLSESLSEHSNKLGFQHKTLEDVAMHFRDVCSLLSTSEDQLLLRYELQGDRKELEQYKFTYDSDWFRGQVQASFKFLRGERQANYVPPDERWKCKHCSFADRCPQVQKSLNAE